MLGIILDLHIFILVFLLFIFLTILKIKSNFFYFAPNFDILSSVPIRRLIPPKYEKHDSLKSDQKPKTVSLTHEATSLFCHFSCTFSLSLFMYFFKLQDDIRKATEKEETKKRFDVNSMNCVLCLKITK